MKLLRVAALAFSICISPLVSPGAFAQSSSDVSAKAENYKLSISTKKEALQTLENRLLAYDVKKEDATKQLAVAKEDLKNVQADLELANQDTSDDGPRKREMAKTRLELAERGVQNREKRLDRVSRKHAELITERDKTKADINWLNRQINSLDKQAQAIRVEEDRFANMQAAASPEPVKIAAPPLVAKPTEPAVVKDVAKQPATAMPAAASTENAAEASGANTQAPQLPATSIHAAKPVNEKDLTPRQRYARSEMQKLNELTKNADKTQHRRYSELLMDINYKRAVELEYLGNEQFYTEVDLVAGKHKLVIDSRKFMVKVPESADGDTYVVIYDTTDSRNERFVFFNKRLLD
ncbi:hypothetical protein SAMN02745866_00672 [Alteromonadaceae bacterium Bs31]|nr:hypothetical protein SAMN02745866_00672 [Alteromonadaceae bacterium Bs31]